MQVLSNWNFLCVVLNSVSSGAKVPQKLPLVLAVIGFPQKYCFDFFLQNLNRQFATDKKEINREI